MKKLILIFALAISTLSYGQKFYTVDAQVVESSIKPFTRIVSDSAVVDSTALQINCWFGQVGNPYINATTHSWCQFNQISVVIKGNAKTSYYLNAAKKLAEAWRQKNYPDIK